MNNLAKFYDNPISVPNLEQYFFTESEAPSRISAHDARFYFSPFNPVFLNRLKDESLLLAPIPLLVRDGLLGLVCFFLRHPRPPEGLKATLLIPFEFQEWVPERWQSHIYLYRYQSNQASELTSKKVVLANLFDGCFNFERFKSIARNDETLAILSDELPEDIRQNYQMNQRIHKFRKNFYSLLPDSSRILGYREMFALEINHHWSLLDCERPLLVYDKWCTHFFRALGLREPRTFSERTEMSFPLTAFENIHLFMPTTGQKRFEDVFVEYKLLKVKDQNVYRVFGGLLEEYLAKIV